MASTEATTQSRSNERWTLIYDGDCGFCRRQIRWIQQRDKAGRFEYLPRQAPGLAERYPFLLEADFNTGLRLIAPEGRVYVGADGVHQIARQLPLWRSLAWVYQVPGLCSLFRALYRWIAANRQRLSRHCPDGHCDIRPASAPPSATEPAPNRSRPPEPRN